MFHIIHGLVLNYCVIWSCLKFRLAFTVVRYNPFALWEILAHGKFCTFLIRPMSIIIIVWNHVKGWISISSMKIISRLNGKTYILLHIFNTKNGLLKWYKHSILYKDLIKSTCTPIKLIVIENCIKKYQHHYGTRIYFFIQLTTTQTIQWSQLCKWFFLSYKCNQAHISFIWLFLAFE